MSEKYQVVVSERAASMLVESAAFLAQVSVAAADRLVDEYEKTINSLSEMPRRCPFFKAEEIPKNRYRYIIFEKRYCALFLIDGKTVYVDYVLDLREDNRGLLR